MANRNSAAAQQQREVEVGAQALIEEIDQEVKAKQAVDFLKKHGKAMAAILLAVILGTAIASAYGNMKTAQQERDTQALIALMQRNPDQLSQDEYKQALKTYVTIGEQGAGEGARVIGRLAEAGLLLAKGERETAVKRLDDMAKATNIRPLYRDFALLMKIRALTDTQDAQQLQDELKPLLDAKNPWYLSALEESAVLYAKAGKKDEAVAQLQGILNTEDAPLSAKERAGLLMRHYSAN